MKFTKKITFQSESKGVLLENGDRKRDVQHGDALNKEESTYLVPPKTQC